jgi:hypothetical protein
MGAKIDPGDRNGENQEGRKNTNKNSPKRRDFFIDEHHH